MTAEPAAGTAARWRAVVGSAATSRGLRLIRYRDVDAYLRRTPTSERLLDQDVTLPTRNDAEQVERVDRLLVELGWERVTGWMAAPGGYETAVQPKEEQ